MIESGMNVVRINMAHATQDFALKIMKNVRDYIQETNSTAQVAFWVDINGPKVRTGRLQDGKPVWLEAGDEFLFSNDNVIGDHTQVCLVCLAIRISEC